MHDVTLVWMALGFLRLTRRMSVAGYRQRRAPSNQEGIIPCYLSVGNLGDRRRKMILVGVV